MFRVIVPGSPSPIFNVHLTSDHSNIQNVSQVLLTSFTVKYSGTPLQDTFGHDSYIIYEDLFLPDEESKNRLLEGILNKTLGKICSYASDKKTLGVDNENQLNVVFKTSAPSSCTSKFG